jgi:hypothetical protein
MKKIWGYLKQHLREDFNAGHYLLMAVFLAGSIALNYAYDYEDSVLEQKKGFDKLFHFFLLYAVAYYGSALSYLGFNKKLYVLVEPEFWIKSLLGLTVLSVDSSMPFLRDAIQALLHPSVQYWVYKVTVNMISFLTVVAPLLIYYRYFEQQQKNLYGFNSRQFDFSPYFIMLLIMLPLIVAASFTEAFQRQYPMYRSSGAHEYLGVGEWVTAGGYELAYGLDFVTVEFLFRGFMVIGLMAVLGRGAVLCMAVTYCFLHFGKPMGEAISSIFGGFILGVIAYETKSVWGGVIIHMGIAWMMDLAAYIQKLFINP